MIPIAAGLALLAARALLTVLPMRALLTLLIVLRIGEWLRIVAHGRGRNVHGRLRAGTVRRCSGLGRLTVCTSHRGWAVEDWTDEGHGTTLRPSQVLRWPVHGQLRDRRHLRHLISERRGHVGRLGRPD